MRETTYILGIKSIKIDKKKRLFRLSQSTYIDKILKWFDMEESKRWYLSILHKIHLSKDMCSKTQIKRDEIEMIPYTLDMGSIIYVMFCTRD